MPSISFLHYLDAHDGVPMGGASDPPAHGPGPNFAPERGAKPLEEVHLVASITDFPMQASGKGGKGGKGRRENLMEG